MGSSSAFVAATIFLTLMLHESNAQLNSTFYANTCPNVSSIVSNVIHSNTKLSPTAYHKVVSLNIRTVSTVEQIEY